MSTSSFIVRKQDATLEAVLMGHMLANDYLSVTGLDAVTMAGLVQMAKHDDRITPRAVYYAWLAVEARVGAYVTFITASNAFIMV